MTAPMKVGALFAGYGGIEIAVHDVLDAEPAWFSQYEPPSKPGGKKPPQPVDRILEHHWPGVSNHGDVTKIGWESVEPVDIITGGSPCQDLSHAGKRAGMKAGTRSGLWASMCDAIDIIRPRLVIWENVRGALSAPADSAVEPCPFCVGDAPGVSLRALGRVLGDLAELGYDAAWYGLRAADVGAPHGRWRVFVLAWPADDTSIIEPLASAGRVDGRPAVLTMPKTPTSQLGVNGGSQHPDKRKSGGHGPTLADEAEHLLPTPVVNDMGAGKTVDAWDAWTERLRESHTNGNGHGASLSIEALRLMPTPRATDGTKGGPNQRGSSGDLMLPSAVHLLPTPTSTDHKASGSAAYAKTATHTPGTTLTDATVRQPEAWGGYAAAIRRWEALTRPAPSPTEPTGKAGAYRLSPRFVEWMQGLPDGHVTDPAIGISRNDQLKALGNGVVPQQCAAALRHLLTIRNNAIREEVAA